MTQKTITKTANKNEKPAEMVNIDGIPKTFDFTTWVDEATGFSPYWNPAENKYFVGRLVSKDVQDPDFVRYLVQAGEDLECAQGPAATAEKVTVRKGEFFTISVYFSLQDIFDIYLESGIRPWMKVTAGKKLPTKKPGRFVFKWRIQVSPADKARTDEAKVQMMREAKATARLPESVDSEEGDEGENDEN